MNEPRNMRKRQCSRLMLRGLLVTMLMVAIGGGLAVAIGGGLASTAVGEVKSVLVIDLAASCESLVRN